MKATINKILAITLIVSFMTIMIVMSVNPWIPAIVLPFAKIAVNAAALGFVIALPGLIATAD